MKETLEFQTESKELLNLMINSIYSNKEIFLREIISNASDAIDKYKFMELTSDGKISSKDYEINIKLNKEDRTISIEDNGIGMSKNEVIENLGTYDPLKSEQNISINTERASYWLSVGAQPTDTAKQVLKLAGVEKKANAKKSK